MNRTGAMTGVGSHERNTCPGSGTKAILVLACLGLWGPIVSVASAQEGVTGSAEAIAPAWSAVPAEFRAGRVFLLGRLAEGGALTFFTDTGGGANMLFQDAAEALGLPVREVGEGEQRVRLAAWPRWRRDGEIPPPGAAAPPLGDNLIVVPRSGDLVTILDPDVQAFLGRTWFGGRARLFDYPAGTLHTAGSGELEGSPGSDGLVALGFQENGKGNRTTLSPGSASRSTVR